MSNDRWTRGDATRTFGAIRGKDKGLTAKAAPKPAKPDAEPTGSPGSSSKIAVDDNPTPASTNALVSQPDSRSAKPTSEARGESKDASKSRAAKGASAVSGRNSGKSATAVTRSKTGAAGKSSGTAGAAKAGATASTAKTAAGAGTAGAAAGTAAATRPARRPSAVRPARKARLRIARIDPWSVMKTSFLFSIAAGIVMVVSVWVLWSVIQASGVITSVEEAIGSLIANPNSGTDTFDLSQYISQGKVMGFTVLVAIADVIILTALATLASFLYNLSSTMLGGFEVTLADD